MEVTRPDASKKKRWFTPLLLGFIVSSVWLLALFVYVYGIFTDVIALSPNNLGDFLAGVFAPLAFLWLFIATLLQRQELELQRQELRETREVMALQKEEMKRAADENSQQTRIMTENLKQEAARIEYERLDTLLYSTALFIYTNRESYAIRFGTGGRLAALSDEISPIDKTNFDIMFATVYRQIRSFKNSINNYPSSEKAHLSQEHKAAFVETQKRLRAAIKLKSSDNELIVARLNGLNFDSIVSDFDFVLDKIAEPR